MKNPLFVNPSSDEEEIQPDPIQSGMRPARKIMRDKLIERREAAAIQPPPSVEAVLNDLLDRHIQFAHDKAEADGKPIDDDEIRHHEESRVVTAFHAALKKYVVHIEETLPKWLWHRPKGQPAWMLKDAVINDILKKTRFWDVLMALRNHSKPKYDEDRSPIYFIGNRDFYDKIAAELKMSRISIQRYVWAFCQVGVLKQLDKTGLGLRAHSQAYRIGYVQKWEGGKKWNLLLIKKLRTRIREFKLPSGKG